MSIVVLILTPALRAMAHRLLTVQPMGQWQMPVTGWQLPWFWHRHELVQFAPWVPGGHGSSHSAPRHPAPHRHAPDLGSQIPPAMQIFLVTSADIFGQQYRYFHESGAPLQSHCEVMAVTLRSAPVLHPPPCPASISSGFRNLVKYLYFVFFCRDKGRYIKAVEKQENIHSDEDRRLDNFLFDI